MNAWERDEDQMFADEERQASILSAIEQAPEYTERQAAAADVKGVLHEEKLDYLRNILGSIHEWLTYHKELGGKSVSEIRLNVLLPRDTLKELMEKFITEDVPKLPDGFRENIQRQCNAALVVIKSIGKR